MNEFILGKGLGLDLVEHHLAHPFWLHKRLISQPSCLPGHSCHTQIERPRNVDLVAQNKYRNT